MSKIEAFKCSVCNFVSETTNPCWAARTVENYQPFSVIHAVYHLCSPSCVAIWNKRHGLEPTPATNATCLQCGKRYHSTLASTQAPHFCSIACDKWYAQTLFEASVQAGKPACCRQCQRTYVFDRRTDYFCCDGCRFDWEHAPHRKDVTLTNKHATTEQSALTSQLARIDALWADVRRCIVDLVESKS